MNHMLKVRIMYVFLAKLGINYVSTSNSNKNSVKRQNKIYKEKDNHESFGSESMLAQM